MVLAFLVVISWLITGSTFGLSFTLSAMRLKLGTTGTLKMNCSVTEIDASVIYNIQIRRETDPGSNYTWETLAEIEAGLKEIPVLDKDIVNDKGFVVGGVLDKDTPINTYLTLDMNKEKLTISDARAYRCELTYKSNITGSVASVKRNASLSIVGDDDHNKTQSDTAESSDCVSKTTFVTVSIILGVIIVVMIVCTIYKTEKIRKAKPGGSDKETSICRATKEELSQLSAHTACQDYPIQERDDVSLQT